MFHSLPNYINKLNKSVHFRNEACLNKQNGTRREVVKLWVWGMLCFPPQYLHNEKKLLHGDMKSCNIVIKGDFETVKICDVGVSLLLDENMRGNDWVRSIPDRNRSSSDGRIQTWFLLERDQGSKSSPRCSLLQVEGISFTFFFFVNQKSCLSSYI